MSGVRWGTLLAAVLVGSAFGILTIEAWGIEGFGRQVSVMYAWVFLVAAGLGGLVE